MLLQDRKREERVSAVAASREFGQEVQFGGALTVFIGVLLLLFGPGAGSLFEAMQMARFFVATGAFLVAAGGVTRWFLV